MQGTVTLDTLAGGAFKELFNEELASVVENILDPNTEAEAKRTITLHVEIKPNARREMGRVRIMTDSKLAGLKPAETVLYFGRVKGEAVVAESNPKQMAMFQQPEPVKFPNVQAAGSGNTQARPYEPSEELSGE